MIRDLRLWVLAGVLAACGEGASKTEGCVSDAECDGIAICTDQGTCEAVACRSSNDCAFDQYCDAQMECRDGCAEDSDCVAGFSCDTDAGECTEDSCESTQLDCEYGQFCDTGSGQCFDDDRLLCGVCTAHADCGEGGRCYTFGERELCFYECDLAEGTEACPRGFQCVNQGNGAGVCVGDCDYMIAGGFLD